ncbi:hypothetical protein F2Q70_00013687 [Brassica cretica]|uniref:Uncharacterized protein n=1 Tax=Brassica cretica TaxID=69181 RepID=A0A8S9M5Y6_BRACR|nr:hypothetical protein F2Q70_00013687 [Brassica cretica]
MFAGDQVRYVGSAKKDEAKRRVVLGKISTSDGQKSAFTVIPGRWVDFVCFFMMLCFVILPVKWFKLVKMLTTGLNLCIAAAYRPVQELLQEEQKGEGADASPCLRPLSSDDFIQSKAKVSPSVAYDATTMNELRKWNEQYGEGGSRTKSPFGF